MYKDYYENCSDVGRKILNDCNFPDASLYEKRCYQVVDEISADFYLGNCLKYLWRLGKKDLFWGLFRDRVLKSDLQKALWYARVHKSNYVKNSDYVAENDSELWHLKLADSIYLPIFEHL